MMKGIIDKSRLERIGKYINRQLIVHRNIENDTKWTTEESMIVELYDNYIELISKINNLQQENQQLKKQLEVGKEQYNDVVEEKENLQEQLSNSHQIKAQQKEFIEWLEDGIRTLEMLDETFTLKNYKNEIRIYKEILSKYKEIIGGKHE